MPANQKDKQRVAYEYATGIGLIALSVCSIIITVVMAARGNSRLPWMVAISLLLVFLTAINYVRVKNAFRSIQRNLRLRRKVNATRGVILRFPEQPDAETGEGAPPEEGEAP